MEFLQGMTPALSALLFQERLATLLRFGPKYICSL